MHYLLNGRSCVLEKVATHWESGTAKNFENHECPSKYSNLQ